MRSVLKSSNFLCYHAGVKGHRNLCEVVDDPMSVIDRSIPNWTSSDKGG